MAKNAAKMRHEKKQKFLKEKKIRRVKIGGSTF